jgi:transcriptional regulator with XRE-family HTH domain
MAKSLKELRRIALLTSPELAEKAGVSPATIWRIESGATKTLRISTARKIANALGVQASEIAEFVGES